MNLSCELCGGTSRQNLPYYYILKGSRIQGVRCTGCGLVSVSPMLTGDQAASLYDEEYFRKDYHCGHRDATYEEAQLTPDQMKSLVTLKKLAPLGKLLEVGAAGGKFLEKARTLGYEVKGVEISKDACALANAIGLDVFCGELSDANLPDNEFQAAYMGDVLEHLQAPLAALSELNRTLSMGGVLCVTCPTNIGLLSSRLGLKAYKLLGRERLSPIPPYHLYEFTAGHLVRLIKKAGFDIAAVDVDIIPPWKISLRGNIIEKAGKLLLHWPNYVITKLTGLMGDRVTIFAKKK